MSRVPARLVRPLFGRVAWTVYVGCLVATLAMFVAEPSLLPTYEDTFIFPDIVLSLLITNVVVIVLTVVHEVVARVRRRGRRAYRRGCGWSGAASSRCWRPT